MGERRERESLKGRDSLLARPLMAATGASPLWSTEGGRETETCQRAIVEPAESQRGLGKQAVNGGEVDSRR
jgi:hypothetical protein